LLKTSTITSQTQHQLAVSL